LSIQKQDKAPSKELLLLIRKSIKVLVKFPELWKKVQEKGYTEGFDNKELQDFARPYLKQKLTTEQIKHLFDSKNKTNQN
jgi:hypothetical protein